MLYKTSRILPYSPDVVWRVIGDVRHYIHQDPFHSELVFTSSHHEGEGVTFTLRHRYWPNFPFFFVFLACRVSVSKPEREQVLVETNAKTYRNHTQRFLLEPVGDGTLVKYEIQYMGIPMWLFPWRWWVLWSVVRRMEEKLLDVEKMCGEVSK